MDRVYNFSAGPSMLPEAVLRKAQSELLNQAGTGMSVMEMSHRSPAFEDIHTRALASLRRLMQVPDNYRILFVQGGASQQFAAVALNLMHTNRKADYIISGNFAQAAYKEAARYGQARIAATSQEENFSRIPDLNAAQFDPQADYLHITTNNTIFGTQYNTLPQSGAVPLVGDMSSNILGKRYNVADFGLIYAGAQKNIAPAGLTIVIVREDLIGHAQSITPTMLDYAVHAKADSLYNTPPCWCIYIAGLVFEHLEALGGVDAMEQLNIAKAALLYDFLDDSRLFNATARREDRSIMNVCFTLPTQELTDAFLKQTKARGLVSLKGHRLVGGIRASIYNAMPPEGVQALVACMKDFEAAQA